MAKKQATDPGDTSSHNTTKKTGRPRKQIDQHLFEELCSMQCTEAEICGALRCDDNTLAAWCERTYGMRFSEVFAQKRQGGKASLRRSQWLMAKSNPTMAIWLGKNYLDQSDDPQKAARERATGDKLDELLGVLTDLVVASGDD